jgi:hypothetical protein
VTLWDVSGAVGPIESLRQQSKILSAHRLESNQGLLPLNGEEMRARWEVMKPGSLR